ncbi:Rieske 2Fe-2S domain-containing protein [Noviherbaspirillum suwonense]|jgi:phenylpropionate dioxygenase-like ring-hydroxylating dioxygenase large terminal subunit|uniref:Rieske [2Fe-2S] domain-containing protein n=1 Tax=Noviherbaspirillum suwonense TaxID=1224511 RepID=A0ABY1Q960_9BURK|nr:Rieske 2Fe-2S domain-containing protein [Noviherbaspirillum suwonense]SMP63757.1 Rieske [2Fe-2S] domain-containing protein [Noviherbaspirillum suwonense]
MLSAADNEMLTRSGPDTPMGQFFRRFWQPVLLSRELPENDGAPKRVTVLGEALVAYRNTRGEVGLVDSKCPHRGASLYFGRNEDCAIRCVFHGWKFDIEGKPVELPNVPPGSQYHKTIRLKSYPTREYGGVVWAYMGPREPGGRPMPEVPQLEFGQLPESHRYVTKKLQECNWAQSVEGALDTSHFSFLHMPAPGVPSNANDDAPADEKRLRWIREDPLPLFSILEHEVGFVVGGARRADGMSRYWRTAQFALPSHSTTPSTFPGETHFGYTWVPIDDGNCWIYTYAWNPDRPLTDDEMAKFKNGHGVIAEVDENYIPIRNRSNEYLIDRQMQKHINFTGVRGVAEQDAMIQDSQGRIVDRTVEHLCASDAAVVRFRRKVLDGAKALMAGIEPEAPFRHDSYTLRSGSWIASEGVSFEQVMLERFGHPAGRVAGSNGDGVRR